MKRILALGLLWLLLAWPSFAQVAAVNPPAGTTFRNPISPNGADPWLTWYNGNYYYTATAGKAIYVRRARRLGDLAAASSQLVWQDKDPKRFRDIWAPELHLLESGQGPRWYLYYTASDGVEPHHRMHVAESSGTDPLGFYHYKAQLLTDPKNEFYAIDGTVLRLPDGTLYLAWCGRPAPTGQGVFIARMANPWTISGPRTFLPADGFGCPNVREAPEFIQRNGKIFLIYSMCDAATPDYKLGMLTADAGANLLDAASWRQHPAPVFAPAPQNGVYGPGHCFFFQSPDGKEDWIAYHAKTFTAYSYGGRSTRVQPFRWNADGTPNFGVPLSLETPVRAPSGEPK